MASIRREISINVAPEQIGDAARDVGAPQTRLVPGFVIDTTLEDAARRVTFGNGLVVRELIIDGDDHARRIARTTISGMFTHYNASFQVFRDGANSRGVWIADLLAHRVAPAVAAMIEQGPAAMKQAMEAS
jgi:hypothetical protein